MKTGKELILNLPNGVRRNLILEFYSQYGSRRTSTWLNSKYKNTKGLVLNVFRRGTYKIKDYNYWDKIYESL